MLYVMCIYIYIYIVLLLLLLLLVVVAVCIYIYIHTYIYIYTSVVPRSPGAGPPAAHLPAAADFGAAALLGVDEAPM